MCELGVRRSCRGNTHGTIVGIALQPTITTSVEAASSSRGKVTVSATLKNNQQEARVRARKSKGENAARHRSWGERRKSEPIYGQTSSYLGLKTGWRCRGETPIWI
jgi:hypothetical protein